VNARRRLAWLGLVALVPALASAPGCAAPRRALPAGAIELPVAGVQQTDAFACGVATVEALAAFHGLALSAETRHEIAARTSAQEGLTGADLRSVLERAGFEASRSAALRPGAPGSGGSSTRPSAARGHARPRRATTTCCPSATTYPPATSLLDPAQGRLVLLAHRFQDC
jgi:hypothetical protein